MRGRRAHAWIPYYRSPLDADALDPSWLVLLAEHCMLPGNTICGLPTKCRVVVYDDRDGRGVTCPVCRSLIASMLQRAFRVLGVRDVGARDERLVEILTGGGR